MRKLILLGLLATLSVCPTKQVYAQEAQQKTEWNTNETVITANEHHNSEAVNFALSKLGYPYSMTRRDSGAAYDCSSLIYYSYKDAGVDLSNHGATTAAEIARGISADGKEIAASALQEGDLIFYSFKKNGRYKNISHVAMYIGNGMQVEASYGKQEVATRPVSLKGAVMCGRP